MHGAVEEKSWKTILDNLKAMVDTTNDICNKVEDPQVRTSKLNKSFDLRDEFSVGFSMYINLRDKSG